MQIDRVSPERSSQFHDFYSIWCAAELKDRGSVAPSLTEEECRLLIESSVATEQVEAFLGTVDDVAVASGMIWYSGVDNLDIVDLHVAVNPAAHRQGFGTKMLDRLVERATELGRHVLLGSSWIPTDRRDDHPYLSFAERHGFAVASVEVRRVLELPVDTALLDAWQAEAGHKHRAYRIETVRGEVPSEWVPTLVAVMNLVGAEAPTGDIELEPRAMTPEIFAAREERHRQAGNEPWRALAIHDGQVVAFTTLAVPADVADVVYQHGTLVERTHRGHGLGLALKTAALRALQTAHSERTYVETQNSEQNGAMVSINEKMGYRPVELHVDVQRILPAITNETGA